MKKTLLILGSALLVFTSCKKEEEQLDATDFTKSSYQKVLLPLHTSFLQEAEALKTELGMFTNNVSTAQLDALRTAWNAAYVAYSPTKVFNIDNIKDNYSHLYFYKFPVDTTKIIANVNTDPTNAIVASNAKGLGAIEYLLYRNGALDSLQSNNKNLIYLTALITDVADKANDLKSMWMENESKYINNEGSNSTNAFNQLVNGMIQFTENLKMLKVGNPLGKQAFDHPAYLLAQAPFSNASFTGIQADYQVLYQLWSGKKTVVKDTNVGLGEIVALKNKDVYEQVNTIFVKLEQDLENLPITSMKDSRIWMKTSILCIKI